MKSEAVAKVRARRFPPYKPTLPMTVTLRLASAKAAEAATRKPGVRRVDEYTVECRVERQCDVVKWIVNTGLE